MNAETRDIIAATTLANLHDELRHERERTRIMAVAWHEAVRTVTQLNTVLRRKNRRIARQHQQLKAQGTGVREVIAGMRILSRSGCAGGGEHYWADKLAALVESPHG